MKHPYEKASALKYRHGKDSAPKLVAKGRGKVAEILAFVYSINKDRVESK